MSTAAVKVFVLTPSYNHGSFLEKRVSSVLNQQFSNFEYSIIDDNSTDSTVDILSKMKDNRLDWRARSQNSGSPFAAWTDILRDSKFIDSDYVWIAESDDFADSEFLSDGVKKLQSNPDAVLYFCNSWLVDIKNRIIGHSINYLKEQFPRSDWSNCVVIDGKDFMRDCILWGQPVPNMSSALIRRDAFQKAIRDDLRDFKLAADWLFVGNLASQGSVIYDDVTHNYFRTHNRTARSETNIERMTVEYLITIGQLSRLVPDSKDELVDSCRRVFQMYFFEKGSIKKLFDASVKFKIMLFMPIFQLIVERVARQPRILWNVLRHYARRLAI